MAQILPFIRGSIALDPETLALATSAYDKAVADIDSAPGVVREAIAKHIIRLIAEGERDPHVLYKRALASTGISA